MADQTPSIGRIVHYRLSAQDAEQIMSDRTARCHTDDLDVMVPWSGNDVAEGDLFPMLIVRTWGDTPTSAVNGQVFLDGNDVFWATSRVVGDQPGTFEWPTIGKKA